MFTMFMTTLPVMLMMKIIASHRSLAIKEPPIIPPTAKSPFYGVNKIPLKKAISWADFLKINITKSTMPAILITMTAAISFQHCFLDI